MTGRKHSTDGEGFAFPPFRLYDVLPAQSTLDLEALTDDIVRCFDPRWLEEDPMADVTLPPIALHMRRFKCHKEVHAEVILDVRRPNESYRDFRIVLQGSGEFVVPKDVFARGTPKGGDYYVVYDDGYQSWSPKATFEAGYDEIIPPDPAVVLEQFLSDNWELGPKDLAAKLLAEDPVKK